MTSTDVVERAHTAHLAELNGRAWIELMDPAVELARQIVGTDFVPRSLRNNAAGIVAAILYGDELGIGPMQALGKISVIDGRPTLSAEAQRALILAAGHELWVEEATNTRVTVSGRRRDSDRTSSMTWTMDDAKRAGLAGRPAYRAYPRQMLTARASADLARVLFADVIGGLAATEEVEALEGGADAATEVEATTTKRRRRRTTSSPETTGSVTTPDPSPEVEEPALPEEPSVEPEPVTPSGPTPAEPEPSDPTPPDTEPRPPLEPEPTPEPPIPSEPQALAEAAAADATEPALMSDPQRRKMQALFRELSVISRDARLEYVSHVAGRKLASSADLTLEEAGRVIEALEVWKANPAGGPFQDGIPY